MKREKIGAWIWGSVALAVTLVVFVIPFIFIFLTATKDKEDAGHLRFTWAENFQLWDNIVAVFESNDYMLVRAFSNSIMLTVFSVAGLVIFCSMAAYVLERRGGTVAKIANFLVLAGLIIPPAIVPTIFLMQALGIYGTFPSLIGIEIAYGTSFCIMMFRAFIASIPRELDEAAIIDGAKPLRVYFSVIFPMLRSVTITAIILNSVFVFNDFNNPLYYLPGEGSETVQLTLFNFQSQYLTSYNLLFTDILLITIPMVILFAIFNKRIVAGMTAGSVKG
ncbi:MAG: carbohydrate ABC transporter permease [Micrococcales bacterium]